MSKQEQLIEFNIQDIISYIVEDTNVEFDEAMNQFYSSETFERLQDIETGLYLESSSYIYDIYKDEVMKFNIKKGYPPYQKGDILFFIHLNCKTPNYSPNTSSTISTASIMQSEQERRTLPVSTPFNSLHTAEPFFAAKRFTISFDSP